MTLLAMPILSFALFSIINANVIYLHKQDKKALSSKAHLKQFSKTGNVVLKFYADWCNPCKRMSPIVDSVAAMMPEFTFIKISRDHFLDLAKKFNITSIPTLVFLKDGKEIGRYDGGPLTEEKLAKLITKTYDNA
jgi:thioredoxin 1